jgi:hypothetical protein
MSRKSLDDDDDAAAAVAAASEIKQDHQLILPISLFTLQTVLMVAGSTSIAAIPVGCQLRSMSFISK